jgi:hypothetical protein
LRAPKSFDSLIDDLPLERRERIEALRRALVKGYGHLTALRKDPDAFRKPWRR